ncbi:MAG: hypothetical protein KDK39_01335 [Leptospiraceae bacterium]|nr:hypothetical protein [Leptospiraceae bacterium]
MSKKNQIAKRTFTPEIQTPESRKRRLQQLEMQINQSAFMQCLALQEIRDTQLYLEEKFESMEEYLRSGKLAIGYRQGTQLLEVINALGSSEATAELMQHNDIKLLTEMINRPDVERIEPDSARVIFADGSERDYNSVLAEHKQEIQAHVQNEVKKEIAKADRDVERSKRSIKELKEQQKHIAADFEEQLENMRRQRDSFAKQLNADPDSIVVITEKNQARKMVHEAFAEISLRIGHLNQVPEELRDAELAANVEQILTALETGVKGLRRDWSAHLFSISEEAQSL